MAEKFVPRSLTHKPKKLSAPPKIKRTKYETAFIDLSKKDSEVCSVNNDENATGKELLSDNCAALRQESSSLVYDNVEDKQDDDEVVYFSKNQRWPEPGEPVCVVCGRYGEYICDQTEVDICSKECKAKNLHQNKSKDVGIEISKVSDNFESSRALAEAADKPLAEAADKPYVYKTHPTVALLTEEQVFELRDRMEISIKGDVVVHPVLGFSHCNFDERLLENLGDFGYKTPTPVQMQVVPVALSGCDVLACAQTGSGKTAAFLLPLITKIHHEQSNQVSDSETLCLPKGLVLAPTRELCMQIEKQAKELMTGLQHMKTALIVGGLPLPNQVYRLKQGVQIVFATPGRLAELLEKNGDVDFSNVHMLVIDEVDVLLQMGFEKQVHSILEHIPRERQTLLFSATIPPMVERLSTSLLTRPVWVSVGMPSAPNMAVKQIVLWVDDKSKKKRLFSLLRDRKYFIPPILVFVDSKMGADLLSEAIQETCKISCTSMHGDKPQHERTHILESFLSRQYDVLVCTGIMGRGLDLQCVKQVINFDMPSSVDEYIHQVGRAGRLGSNGMAITFINNTNKNVFLGLMESIQPHGVKLPQELTNSPYLVEQQRARQQNHKARKRKSQETYVNRENLMDMLKKSTFRRRLKNR